MQCMTKYVSVDIYGRNGSSKVKTMNGPFG